MSYFIFGNLPASVPAVLDTTPCMNEMLNYEDCVHDAQVIQQEVFHPNWPSIWPRMQTDGKILEFDEDQEVFTPENAYSYSYMRPLTKRNKQFLWECEEERFVYKACLREVVELKRSSKHRSWDTAEVSNLSFV